MKTNITLFTSIKVCAVALFGVLLFSLAQNAQAEADSDTVTEREPAAVKSFPFDVRNWSVSSAKASPPTCVALTKECSICSDGNKKYSDNLDHKLSDYQCAAKGSKVIARNIATVLKNSKCVVLSDFCGVCLDNSFVFTKTEKKIAADLYECATSPRTSFSR